MWFCSRAHADGTHAVPVQKPEIARRALESRADPGPCGGVRGVRVWLPHVEGAGVGALSKIEYWLATCRKA